MSDLAKTGLSNPQAQALKRALSETCKHLEAAEALAAACDPAIAGRLRSIRNLLHAELFYVSALEARSAPAPVVAKPWPGRAL